jgi:hypothetical protein
MTTQRNVILSADCLTALPQLGAESIDFILTDPPYITRYKPRDGRIVPNDDNAAWLKPAFAEMYRVLAKDSWKLWNEATAAGWPNEISAEMVLRTWARSHERRWLALGLGVNPLILNSIYFVWDVGLGPIKSFRHGRTLRCQADSHAWLRGVARPGADSRRQVMA